MEDYSFINTTDTSGAPLSFDSTCLMDPTIDYHSGHSYPRNDYPMGTISANPAPPIKDLQSSSSVFPPSPLSPCETVESSGDESKKQPPSPCQSRSSDKARPRLKRYSESQDRISHKQVERKYRDRVKAGMDLLERTCAEPKKEDKHGAPRRPSKIEILADAVDYIHRLRAERDAALQGMETLRTTWKTSAGEAWQQQHHHQQQQQHQGAAAVEESSRRSSDFDGSLFDNQLQIFD